MGALAPPSQSPSTLIKRSHPIKVTSVQPSSNDFGGSIFNTGFFLVSHLPSTCVAVSIPPQTGGETPKEADGNAQPLVEVPGLLGHAGPVAQWLAHLQLAINWHEGRFVWGESRTKAALRRAMFNQLV